MTPRSTEVRCCTPRKSKLFDEEIHVSGCLAGWAGLAYHGNVIPIPPAPVLPVEEREAAMRRHPTRFRRPKPSCAGYTTTCPHKGCHLCLGL